MFTRKKVGFGLLICSTILFLMIPAIPFLDLEVKEKVIVTTALAVLAEITFWIGGFIVGKEIVQKYKQFLNPFRYPKKKKKKSEL